MLIATCDVCGRETESHSLTRGFNPEDSVFVEQGLQYVCAVCRDLIRARASKLWNELLANYKRLTAEYVVALTDTRTQR